MDANIKLQGTLEPGLLMDMLQIMNRRKTLNGYVEVSDALAVGRIWLQGGVIIAANWKERQGELAVESMLRLKQGFFAMGEATTLPAKTISKDTVGLLMLCMRAIGRDALTPAVAACVSQLETAPKATVPESVVPANKAAEPVSVPPHHDGARPRCGYVLAGRWSLGVAAAVTLVALTGIGMQMGQKPLAMPQGSSAGQVVSPAPVVPPSPTAVVPVKPVVVQNDGWPDIMLSALAASGKNHWCAILNGQLLGVGEQVDGVIIRSIRPNGVVLEFQGQRRFLCSARK